MPQDLQQLLLERALLRRPEITGPVNLPEGDPNAPEAQLLRFVGGFLGDQKPGDVPSALGATASLLPLSKLIQLLGKAGKAAQTERQAATAAKAIALDSRISGLPPTGRPPVKVVDPQDAIYNIVQERQAMRRAGQEPIRVPKDKRADGTLPKHKEVIPAYRSKAGVVIDVMDEMKNTKLHPDQPTSMNHLQNFAETAGTKVNTPIVWTDDIGYEGPFGANNPAADKAIRNPARRDPAGPIYLDESPEKIVARMKGVDDSAGFRSAGDKAREVDAFGKTIPHPDMINKAIQDLANYFSTTHFDPFRKTKQDEITDALRKYFRSEKE